MMNAMNNYFVKLKENSGINSKTFMNVAGKTIPRVEDCFY
jgi:hypothetical protein